MQGTAFIAGVIAARVLGVEGRGDLAAVLLWPLLVANIGTLGVDWSLAVAAGRNADDTPRLLRLSWLHGLLVGPLLILICLFVVRLTLSGANADLVPLASIYLWMIPFHLVWMDLLAIDNARQNYARYNRTRFSFYLLVALTYAVLWVSGADALRYFVLANLGAIVLVVLVRVMTSLTGSRVTAPDVALVRAVLRRAGPFALSTAVTILFNRIDVILVLFLLGTHELGLYVVAVGLANVPSLLSQAFMVRTFGSTAGADPGQRWAAVVVTRLRQSLALCGVGALVLIVFMPWIIRLLFGADFVPAANAARVLAVASWLFNGGRIIDEGFRGRGRPVFGTISYTLFILTAVLLAPLMTRVWHLGNIGVAWSVLVAAVVLLVAMLLFFKRHRGAPALDTGGPAGSRHATRAPPT